MRRERSGCLLDEGGRARDWPVDGGTGRCPGVQGGREGPADWRGGPGGCQGGACTLQLGLNGLDGKHLGGRGRRDKDALWHRVRDPRMHRIPARRPE